MPNAVVKSFADKTGKSIDTIERYWDEAKKLSIEDFGEENYAYITGIVKNRLGIKENIMDINEFLNSNKKAKDFINEKVNMKEEPVYGIPTKWVDDSSNAFSVGDEYFIPKEGKYTIVKKQGNKLGLKPIQEAESCKTEEDAQISGSLGNIATGQTGINKSDELEINEAADGKNGYFIIKSKDDSIINGPFEKDAALSRSNKLNTQNDDPTYSSVAELNNGKIVNYVDSKGHSYKENAGGGDGQSIIPQKSADDKKETAKEIEEGQGAIDKRNIITEHLYRILNLDDKTKFKDIEAEDQVKAEKLGRELMGTNNIKAMKLLSKSNIDNTRYNKY